MNRVFLTGAGNDRPGPGLPAERHICLRAHPEDQQVSRHTHRPISLLRPLASGGLRCVVLGLA
jgi:hypothetical protein